MLPAGMSREENHQWVDPITQEAELIRRLIVVKRLNKSMFVGNWVECRRFFKTRHFGEARNPEDPERHARKSAEEEPRPHPRLSRTIILSAQFFVHDLYSYNASRNRYRGETFFFSSVIAHSKHLYHLSQMCRRYFVLSRGWKCVFLEGRKQLNTSSNVNIVNINVHENLYERFVVLQLLITTGGAARQCAQ